MVLRIGIKQSPDHALILSIVLLRLVLEKLHAALAQCNRDLDPFIPENESMNSPAKSTAVDCHFRVTR